MTELTFTEHATVMLEGAIHAAAFAEQRLTALNTRHAGEHAQECQRRVAYWKGVVETGAYPTKRLIGRCPTKGCTYATSQLCPIVAEHFNYAAAMQFPTREMCPEHGEQIHFRPVRGTLKPEVACNEKCTSARGHICECSCAGANHGADL